MRIVSLLPSTTEILFALGAGDDVVGVTFECDTPAEARTRTIVSTSALPPGLSPADIDTFVAQAVADGEDLYHLDAGALSALEADLVVTFYNPRSRGRDWQLPKAVAMLLEHRPASTPVGIVTDASRPAQTVVLTTLGELDVEQVTMLACVVVGSSQSTVVGGRFVTPRGYRWAT